MELKLSNGDILTFVDKIKGKHIRIMNSRMFDREVSMEEGRNLKNLKLNLSKVLDAGNYFDIYCEKIIREGKELPITISYLDDLDKVDYLTVMDVLDNLTNEKKKVK